MREHEDGEHGPHHVVQHVGNQATGILAEAADHGCGGLRGGLSVSCVSRGARMLRFAGARMLRFAGALKLPFAGARMLRFAGARMLRFADARMLRFAGVRMLRFAGARMLRACDFARPLRPMDWSQVESGS